MVINQIVKHGKRDRFEIDTEVKKMYPNVHFCWIANQPEDILRFEGNGYNLCRPPESWKTKYKGTSLENMNVIINGDLILAMCSREQYEEQQQDEENYRKELEQTSKSIDEVKNGLEKIGNSSGKPIVSLESENIERKK